MASWKDKDFDGYLTIDYDKPNTLQFSISYEPETKMVIIERRKIEKLAKLNQVIDDLSNNETVTYGSHSRFQR